MTAAIESFSVVFREILFILNDHEEYEKDEDYYDYCPEGAGDMGWLGYFVGRNDFLEELHVSPFTPASGASVRDVIEPFLRGVCNNKSIRTIEFIETDLLGGEVFTMLGPFFQNNYNLTNINVTSCDFGDEGARLFALALGKCTHKSLRKVELENNNISEEGIVDIITALSMHPNLNYLDLDGNRLRKNGCVALATLLRYSAKGLQHLFISSNEINDEGLEALVPAFTNCSHLQQLFLLNNPSITTRGWQSVATILEAPNCNLRRRLGIARSNVDDEVVAAFVKALANNGTLLTLNMNSNPITAMGWQAFSKVLCNTSSVHATFLSNHTLYDLGSTANANANANAIIRPLLRLNRRDDKKEVATIKILQNHDDFDMLPFFEWEFKCLPMVLEWLERVSAYEIPEDFEPNIDGRKLSTIYQFVRGLPLLYVETRLRKELEDIKAEESQMEDEQLLLDHRKQLARERKASIMRRLGQQ